MRDTAAAMLRSAGEPALMNMPSCSIRRDAMRPNLLPDQDIAGGFGDMAGFRVDRLFFDDA